MQVYELLPDVRRSFTLDELLTTVGMDGVLHRTQWPPAVRPAAIIRVTVDLPRVPFT